MTAFPRPPRVQVLSALAAALTAEATPPAPPIRARPQRFGNGRVEIQVYPAANQADRIAAAVSILAGTGFRVVREEI